MKHILIILLALGGWMAEAKVEVLFHPHDPTLEKIGEWISQANRTVDIAMYNMDVSDGSPVVQALKAPGVRQKIENGSLKIRLIYEGYDTKEQNFERMGRIEELGIDVRYLGKGAKMHHKFAVIDLERVISGSANWSMSSYRNYNENILFLDREQEANFQFNREFARLWNISKEYGRAGEHQSLEAAQDDRGDLAIHFNSPRILKNPEQEQIFITDQLVRLIDGAKNEIDIATTRIRLEPLLEAVNRAAARGVRVRILLSQDDYHDLWKRAKWIIDVPGIELRVKFYNLKVSEYMLYQMHNKFIIVDHQTVATGSFNWSKSGENNHIENLVELSGPVAREVLPAFESEFALLWDLGRAELDELQARLRKWGESGSRPPCGFKPTSLEIREIKQLLLLGKKCAG